MSDQASSRPAARHRTAFFTICSKNYLAFARSWAQSAARQHPEASLFLCLADEVEGYFDSAGEPFAVVEAKELGIPDFAAFAFRYEIMEFNTAVKPFMFKALFERGFERVVYFDPDIVLYRPIRGALDLIEAGASSVLTPHALSPSEHVEPPNDFSFLRAGAYNLGFLALHDEPAVHRTLDWWGRRLLEHCLADAGEPHLFVDQKWMDLWPSYCPETAILRHPGYNVAYWNLDQREIAQDGEGCTAGGAPLVFFHYSGIVTGGLTVLSRYQSRLRPSDLGPALPLFEAYHDTLEGNGHGEAAQWPYAYASFADGTPIPKGARQAWRSLARPPAGNPFIADPEFYNRPAEGVKPNPEGVVTQLGHGLWLSRKDLQARYNLGSAQGQIGFATWFVERAGSECGIDPRFVEPVATRLQRLAAHSVAPYRRAARLALRMLRRFLPWLRPLYRHVDPATRRRVVSRLERLGWPAPNPEPVAPERLSLGRAPVALRDGVTVIGYPFGEFGVGEALRSMVRAIAAARIPLGVFNFDKDLEARQTDYSVRSHVTGRIDRRVNLVCINADLLKPTTDLIGPAAFAGRYNIARPFWELERIHRDWVPALETMDEIWAPTHFVREAFARSVTRPVTHVPVVVDFPAPPSVARSRHGLPEDAFLFLFSFDFASFTERKNPLGVVEAFRKAFPDRRDRDVGLVLKSMGKSRDRDTVLRALQAEAEVDTRIHLIDDILSRDAAFGLLAACDSYVSLHRCEGFGYGMAEAMALGKPVIGTDYSGNRDFLNAETGYPVPYELIPIGPDDYTAYVPGQVWADPDLDFSARTMVEIRENQDTARARGAVGRQFIRENHSSVAVGRIVANRLRELGLYAEGEGG